MNIRIPQPALVRELDLLSALTEKRTTIPVLSCVKMVAGDGLELVGSNLEQGITARVECTVETPGSVCVPLVRLLGLVRSLSGDISLTVGPNNYVTVTAGRSRSRIPGMSVESFPELPTVPEPTNELVARFLARQFAKVAYAISIEQSRFTLNGARVEFSGSLLRCVATDGHRLALADSDCATGTKTSFLIPKAAITTYAKLVDAAEGGGRVKIGADDNHLFFGLGQRSLVVRKLTGNFPDYKRVLTDHQHFVTFEREPMIGAISRVLQFADERSRAIRLTFTDSEVRLNSSSIDSGESEESVPVGGNVPLEIGFNGQYLLDALKAIDHSHAAVYLKDAKAAGEIRPMGGAGTDQDPYRVATDYRVVVMPMRI